MILKKVQAVDPGAGYEMLQALYLDRSTSSLFPDLCIIDHRGEMLFQTNALALRGPDVGPDDPIGVVWGDSVVFGVPTRGWPEMLNDLTTRCVFLNGGIEGIPYSQVLERAVKFNLAHAVCINIILPGWHPVEDNVSFRADLVTALEHIRNPVLVTMPTCMNESMLERDLTPLFVPLGPQTDWRTYDEFFGFWGSYPYSIEFQKRLFAHIEERNEAIREVASARAVPLVDLFVSMDSTNLEVTSDFFDVSHPRPRAYPKIASSIYAGIKTRLEVCS